MEYRYFHLAQVNSVFKTDFFAIFFIAKYIIFWHSGWWTHHLLIQIIIGNGRNASFLKIGIIICLWKSTLCGFMTNMFQVTSWTQALEWYGFRSEMSSFVDLASRHLGSSLDDCLNVMTSSPTSQSCQFLELIWYNRMFVVGQLVLKKEESFLKSKTREICNKQN